VPDFMCVCIVAALRNAIVSAGVEFASASWSSRLSWVSDEVWLSLQGNIIKLQLLFESGAWTLDVQSCQPDEIFRIRGLSCEIVSPSRHIFKIVLPILC